MKRSFICATLLIVSTAVHSFAGDAAPERRRIVIATDTPESPFVRSIKTLCPDRAAVIDLTTHAPGAAVRERGAAGFLVTEVRDDAHRTRLDLKRLRDFAADGGICLVGLDEFARLHELPVATASLPNRNHIPELKPEQWKALIAATALVNGNISNPLVPRIQEQHRASIANQFVQWSGATPLQAEAILWFRHRLRAAVQHRQAIV